MALFSTRSIILDITVSSPTFSALTVIVPFLISPPAKTFSPSFLMTGIYSPDTELKSTMASPDTISPSTHIFSPAWMTTLSSFLSLSTPHCSIFPSSFSFHAVSSSTLSSFLIEFLVLSTVYEVINSAISDRAIIVRADIELPNIILATIEVTVKKSALGLFVSTNPSHDVFRSGDVRASDVNAGTVVKLASLDIGYSGNLADGRSLVPSITPPFIKSLTNSFLDDSFTFSYFPAPSIILDSI